MYNNVYNPLKRAIYLNVRNNSIMKNTFVIFIAFGIFSCMPNTETNESEKIENIRAFTKVYGYVKYFHPSDEASQIDWEKFSIYGVKEIQKCNTTAEVIETLNRLFIPIAPSINFSNPKNKVAFNLKVITPENLNEYKPIFWQHHGVGKDMNNPGGLYTSIRVNRDSTENNQLFSIEPDVGEIIEKEISDGIFLQIPLVLYGDSLNTYPQANSDLLFNLIKELKNCKISPDLLSARVGNIVNVYNVFQHFYPYFDVVEVDWDKEFSRAIQRSYLDKSNTDHLITLQKFTATLKDGHIWVSGEEVKNRFVPSIVWEWVEDQLVVIRSQNSEVEIGEIITHINGQTAKEYFEEINSTISAGTEGWLNYRAQYISLEGPQDSKITLTIDNTDIDLIRDRNTFNGNPLRIMNGEEHRIIEDGIHYLNLDKISMEDIDALLPDLSESYAIICDLRGYPKGNHGFINHLLRMNDTTASWMQVPRIIYPDHKKVQGYSNYNWIKMMKPKKPYLGDKQIVFIVNGSAISYAESYMGYIEGYELATIVGQPTAGTNGNVNSFSLPGGYTISWTGMKVVKHDGSQHHGIGVLPNVYVNKTIQGIKEGRDEYLERAIEISKQE